MIRAVIFDMDGVLIDAREWHFVALNRALELFGYEIHRAEHLAKYDGLPTSMKLEMLSSEYGFPRGLHSFVNELKQMYTSEMIHVQCKPQFVHQYALSRLRADGFKLGLASNSIRETVELMMGKARLGQYLDVMLASTDVGRPKPYADVYLEAASRLEIPPNECLVVEDNEHGLAAARAAGCNVLEVIAPSDVTYLNIRDAIERFAEGES